MSYKDIARDLIKRSEKCVLTGYPDQGGVPTDGWGNTGPGVKIGKTITQEQADYDLDRNIEIADETLLRDTNPAAFAKLSDHEKAALLDFVFNTGGNSTWTIWKDVNANNLADVPKQLDRFIYVHIDGKAVTSNGLKNRRAAERTLWTTADVAAAVAVANAGGETVSSSIRVLPTPPQTVAPKTLSKTSLGLKLAGLGSAASGLVAKAFSPDGQAQAQNVHDTVVAHASSFGHFGAAIASVCGAAVVCVAVGQLVVHLDQQNAAKV